MALALSSKIIIYALSCFIIKQDDTSFTEAKNQVVNQYKLYSAEHDLGIKTNSFEISEYGFIKYRKTDSANKSVLYSVKLSEFKDAIYLGDEKAGWLIMKFTDEAVIYQTYNDKAGNVDEMLAEIKIPLKNIAINEINSFCNALNVLKNYSLKP